MMKKPRFMKLRWLGWRLFRIPPLSYYQADDEHGEVWHFLRMEAWLRCCSVAEVMQCFPKDVEYAKQLCQVMQATSRPRGKGRAALPGARRRA